MKRWFPVIAAAILTVALIYIIRNTNNLYVLAGIGFGVLFLAMVLGIVLKRQRNATPRRTKTDESLPPLIRMAFNGQEFAVRETLDMGDHWLFKGYITESGGYREVEDISFRVKKGVTELRLGYYMNHNHVLVNISNPNDTEHYVEGFLADTDRVWVDFFPFPKSM